MSIGEAILWFLLASLVILWLENIPKDKKGHKK